MKEESFPGHVDSHYQGGHWWSIWRPAWLSIPILRWVSYFGGQVLYWWGGVIGQAGDQKRSVSFYGGIHAPFPQLLAPWNGTPSFGPRPPRLGAEHSSSLWNSLASGQGSHLGCAAGFRTFQGTLALGSVLGLLALTQFEGVIAHISSNGTSCSSTPAVQCREGVSALLRQREQGHEVGWISPV